MAERIFMVNYKGEGVAAKIIKVFSETDGKLHVKAQISGGSHKGDLIEAKLPAKNVYEG